MKTREKTSAVAVKMVIAIIIALYVLFPFFLVVINSCKPTDMITANPIGLEGVSLPQPGLSAVTRPGGQPLFTLPLLLR